MKKSLKGQRIFVTGAGSGIGLATARSALEAGAAVALVDNGQSALHEARVGLAGLGDLLTIRCDVTEESSIESALDAANDELGAFTGIVSSAGIDIGGPIHELDRAAWDQVIGVNLTGTFLTLKHGIRRMRHAGIPGSVVCVSSPAARVAFASGGAGAYSASKAGVSALVRAAAVDYAREGIRVNAVVPGPTDTPLMWANVARSNREEMREQVLREVPLGRIAAPDEPAAAIVWLLSGEARYVTGTELICDGGILAKGSISV